MPGRDIGRIRAIAREFGMDDRQRRGFGDYVEEYKRDVGRGSGPNGDFTYEELRARAREYLEETE